jgi:hypothetical protein
VYTSTVNSSMRLCPPYTPDSWTRKLETGGKSIK